MEKETPVVESENVAAESAPKNEFAGSRNDSEFNYKATRQLNLDLARGSNPSAKYLKQKIESKHLPESITKFLNEILGFIEYVDAGKGVEYILTALGTVTAMDPTAFVPTEVYEMDKDTYIDTLDLPEIGSNKTKAMERSVALYKYIQYYLSGKANEVANIIIAHMDDSMLLSVFQDLLAVIQRMYNIISAKSSGTNYLEGTATTAIDAMKEFRDFVTPMLSHNVKFNWGIDDGDHHEDFTDAPNFASTSELKFITDYRTYNNIKKILPTIFNDDKLAKSLLGDESNWVIVPTSYLEVTDTTSGTINGIPTLVEDFSLFMKTEGEAQVRQQGTIMVVQKNDIKCAYNFEQNESEYYPKNCVTQVFKKKNLSIKALKWAQVGVFKNAHLEDAFAIPTTTVNAK